MTTEEELTIGIIGCDLSSSLEHLALVTAISENDSIRILEINHLTEKMSPQEIMAMVNERSEDLFDDMLERFELIENHFPQFEMIAEEPKTEHDWFRRFEKIRKRKGKY